MQRPYEVLRGPMRLWYSRLLANAPMVPSPRTSPTATAGHGDADRVLLVGNGPLHGWGVLTHGLSVVGHLADDLAQRTGRAAQVDFVGDERMTMASARAWLGNTADAGYDIVVVAVGMNDALRLEPLDQWRRSLDRLLDAIVSTVLPSTRILLVELPRIRAYQLADGWFGTIAQAHARRLDGLLTRVARSSHRIEVIPAPVERFEPARPLGSSAAYQHWAQQLAASVAPALDTMRTLYPPLPEADTPAFSWAGTSTLLDAARNENGHAALTEITTRAQQRFGVALGAVNILDGDRIHFAANTGGAPVSMPSELAYCATTIAADAPLVVEDSNQDPRFTGNPFLDVVRLPYYAGIPLHSRNGQAIGTLCLLDSEPHNDTFLPLDELQRFADEAQAVLHAVEKAAVLHPELAHQDSDASRQHPTAISAIS